jgi:hypothetical protein
MNKVLTRINVLLGVLAMFFAGCHTQSKTVRDRGPIAKYGVPQEVLDRQRQEQEAQQQPATETEIEAAPAEENGPVAQPKKYGPRPPRN